MRRRSTCTVTAAGSGPRHGRQLGVEKAFSSTALTAAMSALATGTLRMAMAARCSGATSSAESSFSMVAICSALPMSTTLLEAALSWMKTWRSAPSAGLPPVIAVQRISSTMVRTVSPISVTLALRRATIRKTMSEAGLGLSKVETSPLTCSKSASAAHTMIVPVRLSPTTATRLVETRPGREETCARSAKNRCNAAATASASARSSLIECTGSPPVSAVSMRATRSLT